MSAQLELVPLVDPMPTLAVLPLDRLPPDDQLLREPPLAAFVRDVCAEQLQPILAVALPPDPDGLPRYGVIDGRARVKGRRAGGCTTIMALVLPEGAGDSWSRQALRANIHRRANPLLDLAALQDMRAAGMSDAAIMAATGMSPAVYHQRWKLARLIPPLAAAVARGACRVSAAIDAADLSRERQEVLARRLEETGKLTAADVRDARRARAAEATATLAGCLFVDPPWQTRAAQGLRWARDAYPADDPARTTLTELLDSLEGA